MKRWYPRLFKVLERDSNQMQQKRRDSLSLTNTKLKIKAVESSLCLLLENLTYIYCLLFFSVDVQSSTASVDICNTCMRQWIQLLRDDLNEFDSRLQ